MKYKELIEQSLLLSKILTATRLLELATSQPFLQIA